MSQVHSHVYILTYVHIYVHMQYMFICTHMHVCICTNICTHMYRYAHICMYIHVYIAIQCVRELYKNLKNGCCTHILNFWSFIYWSYSLRNHICIQYTLSCQPLTPPRVYPPTPSATSCPCLGPTESNQSFPYAH